MLDMGQLQTLVNTITNLMVLRTNGKVLSEEEYLYLTSCLKTVQVHNQVQRYAMRQQLKELKHAIRLDKTINAKEEGQVRTQQTPIRPVSDGPEE